MGPSKVRGVGYLNFVFNLYFGCAVLCFFILLTGPRISQIADLPILETAIQSFKVAILILAVFLLILFEHRKLTLILVTFGLLLSSSFSHLYQPSLNFSVPIQDWMLADKVSSNYSFEQVKAYLKNIFVPLILLSAVFLPRTKLSDERKAGCVFWVVILAFICNSIVASIQGFYGLSFLAQGSGTAVGATRAAGLLEDSGASTVYFAMMVSGTFSALVLGHSKKLIKVFIILLLLAGCIAGAQTSGRTFFLSTIISVLALTTVAFTKALKSKDFKVVLFIAIMFLLFCGVFTYMIVWKMQAYQDLQAWAEGVAEPGKFSIYSFITELDPVRSVHWLVMIKTFFQEPIFGTGLGTFYSNYFEHLDWALGFGGRELADPPSSFYLMLMSELGLAGVILTAGFWAVLGNAAIMYMSCQTSQRSTPQIPGTFCLGAAISLGISLSIGMHFLFSSIGSLAVLTLWPLVGKIYQEKVTIRRISYYLFSVLLLFLALSCMKAYINAPRPPAFRWEARGVPQVPISLNVPIAVPTSKGGVWLQSGAEIALYKPKFSFFVEMPSTQYPLDIHIRIMTARGVEIAHGSYRINEYSLPRPGKVLSFDIPPKFHSLCFDFIDEKQHCGAQIETKPEWRFNGAKVGFFVFASQVDYRKLPK